MAKVQYFGVGGVARKVKSMPFGVGGVARNVKSGYFGVGGVARQFLQGGTLIGDLNVGTIVKLAESGNAAEYLIVHKGKPSSIYDSSCDGVWLLRNDIYEKRVWNTTATSSNDGDYENSMIHSYLNGTFYNKFDAAVRSKIKQVKIPYRKGPGTSLTVTSGASGLSAKVFLLSFCEVHGERLDMPKDGARLSYFKQNGVPDAYLNGVKTAWFHRTPYCDDEMPYGYISVTSYSSAGSFAGNGHCTSAYGIRPALIIPSDVLVDDSMNIIA